MPETFTITFNSDDALLLRAELKLRDGDPWPDTGEKFFKAREMADAVAIQPTIGLSFDTPPGNPLIDGAKKMAAAARRSAR